MVRFIVFLVCILCLSGCAKLAHIKELLILKDFSQEQEAQERIVQDVNQRFTFLLKHVANNTLLPQFENQDAVFEAFGKPILSKEIYEDGAHFDRWLYRRATGFNDEKVYLYFDDNGKLIQWKHVGAR